MSLDFNIPDVFVMGADFSMEGPIQIRYIEKSDISDKVTIQRAITIDPEEIADELTEVQELLCDIVDKGLLIKRNPPKKFRGYKQRQEEDDEDESSD